MRKIKFHLRSLFLIASSELCFALVAIIILFPSEDAQSEVWIGSRSIVIHGNITKKDLDAIRSVERDLTWKTVYVGGPGGDLSAALEIGRIIRKQEGKVYLGLNSLAGEQNLPESLRSQRLSFSDEHRQNNGKAVCNSSCAFIYFAGVGRVNLTSGGIGLHRPYAISIASDPGAARAQYEKMRAEIRKYFHEMDIDDSLFNVTMNTEPAAMKVLYGDELRSKVPVIDPAHEAVTAQLMAKLYSISPQELRTRQSRVSEKCFGEDFLKGYVQAGKILEHCIESERWGIPINQVIRNYSDFLKCQLTPEEEEKMRVLRETEKLSSKSMERIFNCQKSALLK